MKGDKRLHLQPWPKVNKETLSQAIAACGGWDHIRQGTRVLIKPNLTYPYYQPGVTTPPDTLQALVELLLDLGAEVTICEGGTTSDLYTAWESFEAHGVLALRDEYGVRVVDLCQETMAFHSFGKKASGQRVPVPLLLGEADLFITMPLIKVHAMTTVSLAMKNQWGLIPSKKRFQFHPALNDILIGLNSFLPPAVLVVSDARTVLDRNGPMFGTAREGGFLAVSNDVGAFDYAITRLMGFNPAKISHLRAGMRAGLVPRSMDEIAVNVDLLTMRPFKFTLRRTLQNYIALFGFHNRWICRLGYDSFASGFLHKLLYAVKGNPLQEAIEQGQTLHCVNHSPENRSQ
jgi:uncharacterized protein (DUF362 family)